MKYPVLWHFPISHYNEKVRWALDYKGIPHIRRALFLSYLPKALWKTGQPSLPILIVQRKAVADSTRIIAMLERQYPNPPLYPSDMNTRHRALELEDYFDEELGPALRTVIMAPLFEDDPDTAVEVLGLGQKKHVLRMARTGFKFLHAAYKWRHQISTEALETGRLKVVAALDRIISERQPSGYLAGDHFSVADLTAAALFCPLVQPPEFPYPLPATFRQRTESYRSSLAGHPAFRWVMDIYQRHRGQSSEVGDET